MKTLRILFSIVFTTIGVCKIGATQTDSAFYFAEGTTWTTSFRSAYGGCDDWTKTCVMQGDTLIGDSTYHNILYNDGHGELIVPIREENKRIFAYLDKQDHLLYDFNLVVGDSLPLCMFEGEYDLYCAYYTYVTAVDSVILSDGRKAKRLTYALGRLPDIEFVGGMYGFLAPIVTAAITTCGGPPSSCCSLNGEPIYETSPGTCASLNPAPPVCADTWHAVSYENAYGEIKVTGVQYSLGSDTVLNRRHYRKIMENNRYCVGGIRQSEDGLKVYFHGISPWSYTPNMQECLLYDFSANVGDTLNDAYFRKEDMTTYIDWMGEPESLGWIVTEKDTIDGRIHMAVERYYADSDSVIIRNNPNHYAFKTHWIQGVGTPNVLWPKEYGTSAFNTLYTLCAMRGDETLYTYNLESLKIENNCTEWRYTALDDIQADDHSPRKFLLDGQLFIETPLGIFNAMGQQIE